MKYTIYKITNKTNGKFYIGITAKTLETRWRGHCRKANIGSTSNFHQAIIKYGFDNWNRDILEEFYSSDKKYAYAVEQRYIDEYQAYYLGYNMDVFGWNITDKSGVNNPMYGKVSGNAKKVSIEGVTYNSLTEASKELGKNINTISRWCNSSKYPECYYL